MLNNPNTNKKTNNILGTKYYGNTKKINFNIFQSEDKKTNNGKP